MYRTGYREISSLTIQVHSQFFYEWLEEHYIGLLKKTITKELGAEGRLEYSIIMDSNTNSKTPYSIKVPTSNKKNTKNPMVNMPIDLNKDKSRDIPNPFIIPGLKKVIRGIWSFSIPIKPSYEGIVTSLASDLSIELAGVIISIVNLSDIICCL